MFKNSLLINSILIYTISFGLIFLIHELGLVIAGSIMGLDPILYHNTMTYTNLQNEGELIAFMFGPLAALLVGGISFLIFKMIKRQSLIKLFFIWFYLQGTTLFFSQLPGIPFSKKGDLGKVVTALDLSMAVQIILSVIGLAALIYIGAVSAKYFLQFAASVVTIDTKFKRRIFLLWYGIIPWLAGTFLSLPFRVPPLNLVYVALPLITGHIIVWAYIHSVNVKPPLNLYEQDRNISTFLIFIYVAMIGVFQLFLTNGIRF